MTEPLLKVTNLRVEFGSVSNPVAAVRGLSFDIDARETVAIVGESGSGKSTSALAVLGLLSGAPRVTGSIVFEGQELLGRSEQQMQRLRGSRIAYVPQNPFGSLNPVFTIGAQIVEAIRAHRREMSASLARSEALDLIAAVGIDNPSSRFDAFPHQISGGMRQRVVIAMALANRPSLIIADEPTSALDVTVRAQVLDALERARALSGAGLLLITHDMGIVARYADRVQVMYAGTCVESGPTEQVFAHPRMPFTMGLLAAIPRVDVSADTPLVRLPPGRGLTSGIGCPFADRCPAVLPECRVTLPPLEPVGGNHSAACIRVDELDGRTALDLYPHTGGAPRLAPGLEQDPVLTVAELVKHFPIKDRAEKSRKGVVHAVCDISLELRPGETLAIVGESGSGKTTLSRTLARLEDPTSGRITIAGTEITTLSQRALRPKRRLLQMVLQDSTAALNSKLTIEALLTEPLRIHERPRSGRVEELLRLVGLSADLAGRYPGELSGGQRQRVAIARALAVEPSVLILDEPVSALDVSVQADVLALLRDIQDRLGVSYIFITHDLGVVRHIADRVAVMYLGRIVEEGPVDAVLSRPQHPYTRALLSAVPIPDPAIERTRILLPLTGEVPAAAHPPSGCRFRTRCPLIRLLDATSQELCATDRPMLHTLSDEGSAAACHHLEKAGALDAEPLESTVSTPL